MAENKVKFGLENVYVAVATIGTDNTATYATPIHNPGAVNLSMEPQGELTPFRADNMDYYVSNGNSGYEGDLEVARFLDAVRAAIWGIITAGNGIQYESINAQAVHFALLFEFKGDVQKVRHVLYNCVATRPAIASATTPDGAVEPQTETSTLTASAIHVDALNDDIVHGKCYPGDPAYDDWFTAVTLPTAAAPGNSAPSNSTPAEG